MWNPYIVHILRKAFNCTRRVPFQGDVLSELSTNVHVHYARLNIASCLILNLGVCIILKSHTCVSMYYLTHTCVYVVSMGVLMLSRYTES